jgi:hypothetical protein
MLPPALRGPINRRMRTQDGYGAGRPPRLMRPMLIAGAAEVAMQHEGPRRASAVASDSARC